VYTTVTIRPEVINLQVEMIFRFSKQISVVRLGICKS
jgi:hypothetical protein